MQGSDVKMTTLWSGTKFDPSGDGTATASSRMVLYKDGDDLFLSAFPETERLRYICDTNATSHC